MHWLNPAALSALGLVAVPVLIHLLRTHHAERVAFPTLRFVHPSRSAAVRMRLPSDLLLLVTRIGIVTAAVCAVAQPLALTSRRLEDWNARIARVVIVDTGATQRSSDAAAASTAAAEAEAASAAFSLRFDSPDVPSSIPQAVSWLQAAPPARRELVVISDFAEGTMDAADVRALPDEVGFRTVQVGTSAAARRLTPVALLGSGALATTEQDTTLAGASTIVRLRERDDVLAGLTLSGRATDALLRAVASSGAPAPVTRPPLSFYFADRQEQPPTSVRAIAAADPESVKRVVLRLLGHEGLQAAAREDRSTVPRGRETGTVIARDVAGSAVVRAGVEGDELVIEVAAPSTSYLAAATVRAGLEAVRGPLSRRDQEIVRIPQDRLASWIRSPGAVEQSAWRQAAASDARWLWAAVLILMAIEQWMRRSAARGTEAHVAAA